MYITFLISVFVLCVTGHSSSCQHDRYVSDGHHEIQQVSLGNFSITDSCEYCSGGIYLVLIVDSGKVNVRPFLNRIIMDSLIKEAPGSEYYSVEDFERNTIFGEEDCIGINITTRVNVSTRSIVSLTASAEGVCGTSVSDNFPKHHITIDLDRNEVLSLEKIIKREKWVDFERFVSKYATAKKIDNVYYSDEHDQRKITYLTGLRSSFYVTEGALGVYTLIEDNNPPDWSRRSSIEEIVGIEYMNVELPISEIKKFIDPNTTVSSLISK